ncbi:MAG TPA: Sua5/YciO/YrdC/YwlC family protein [Gaiellales bacterium]|nr:Sua5/YciO/YrdC/YwlC family protein [Gaiellales bacterium]
MTEHEQALREGGLAILPTDTVYGIGCAASLPGACARLYALKARPADQPTAVVLGSVDALTEVLPELSADMGAVVRNMLPGPVTLIVPTAGRRFKHVCGATVDRIGVRVPVLPVAVAALADAVGGLALTSANARGGTAPARLADVPDELRAAAAFAIDAGALPGVPSTVIDVTGPRPVVLRPGPAPSPPA